MRDRSERHGLLSVKARIAVRACCIVRHAVKSLEGSWSRMQALDQPASVEQELCSTTSTIHDNSRGSYLKFAVAGTGLRPSGPYRCIGHICCDHGYSGTGRGVGANNAAVPIAVIVPFMKSWPSQSTFAARKARLPSKGTGMMRLASFSTLPCCVALIGWFQLGANPRRQPSPLSASISNPAEGPQAYSQKRPRPGTYAARTATASDSPQGNDKHRTSRWAHGTRLHYVRSRAEPSPAGARILIAAFWDCAGMVALIEMAGRESPSATSVAIKDLIKTVGGEARGRMSIWRMMISRRGTASGVRGSRPDPRPCWSIDSGRGKSHCECCRRRNEVGRVVVQQ